MLQNLSLLNEIIPEIEVMNKMRNPLLDDRLIEVTLLEDRLYWNNTHPKRVVCAPE